MLKSIPSFTARLLCTCFSLAEIIKSLRRPYEQHYGPESNYFVGERGNRTTENFCRPNSYTNVKSQSSLYTEGNAITWLFAVPYDFDGLHALLTKNNQDMVTRLDEYFTVKIDSVNRADYTGLIGAYAHGNEPAHHVAFWYNFLGQHEKADKYIKQILNQMYGEKSDRIVFLGNDDAGQISAWWASTPWIPKKI